MPLDPSRPSLARLPEPVVRLVLDFLQLLAPQTIPAVALSASSLYEQARYVEHKLVRVNVDESGHALDRLRLIERLGQLAAVRTLQISGRKYDAGEEIEKVLARLEALIPAMTGLDHLHWNVCSSEPPRLVGNLGQIEIRRTAVPIPEPILEAMRSEARLHTTVMCSDKRESHLQARAALDRLAESQSLYSLSICIIFIDEQDCLLTMRALKRVLLSCPNLRRLPSLYAWYRARPCDARGPPQDGPYIGLGFANGERPPALEELGMGQWPFGWEASPAHRGYPEKGYEWTYWAETFDWSRVVRLCPQPIFLDWEPRVAAKFTSLKEISRDGSEPGLDEFFEHLTAPLELIKLPCWASGKERDLEIMERFGSTLKELEIHRPEPSRRHERFMTAADAARLSKSLVCLERLTLDVLRDEDAQDWPYETLAAVATFPSLRTVKLCFARDPGRASAPSLTFAAAGRLFAYLRERNGNIREVTVGADEGRRDEVEFVCRMAYAGESPEAGGRVDVSCAHLGDRLNAEVRRLVEQTSVKRPDVESLDADGVRVWVALQGPLSDEERAAWEEADRLRRARAAKWKKVQDLRGLVSSDPARRQMSRRTVLGMFPCTKKTGGDEDSILGPIERV